MCQPLINDNVGFGPCIENAASPIECHDLRDQIVSSYTIARFMKRPVHEDTAALVRRLGIPEALIAEWVENASRISQAKEQLRMGMYGEGPCAFAKQAADWIGQADSDERLFAFIEQLRSALDPTEGGTRKITMGEISEWHARLANRAADVLADPGDWEAA